MVEASASSKPEAITSLDELAAIYRDTRAIIKQHVQSTAHATSAAVVAASGSFVHLGTLSRTFAFDLFVLRDKLRVFKAACEASYREEEHRLALRLRPLEVKLQEILEPLEVAYLEKLVALLKVYAYAYSGTNYPPESHITRVYREQLVAPTFEGYCRLQAAARKLKGSLELALGWAWREEQEKVAEELDVLEVQFLLSFSHLLFENGSLRQLP